MSNKLVSVIIPCYNAEKWIKEAIDSCLNQIYSLMEVIVIDDGSNDSSLNMIKSYENKVIWESGPNRGGNYARNRGFALSKGQYIQFLDADDYLLPEKIAAQVNCLEKTGADVVYGDWRYQRHYPNGKVILEDIKVSGKQQDILESLLADWWVSPACILFRREAVNTSNGWDETLKAGQDRDFFLSVVMNGAHVAYQPGCYSIYRRYGNVTVSTSSKTRSLENQTLILEKAEQNLIKLEKLSVKYKNALAQSYFLIARGYLNNAQPILYLKFLDKVLTLSPNFRAKSSDRTKVYNFAQKIFGFRRIEKITFIVKRLKTSAVKTVMRFTKSHSDKQISKIGGH